MVILSDLSEVLIRGLWGAEEYLAKIYGDVAAKAFIERSREVNSTFQELLRGKITEDDYWRAFFATGGVSIRSMQPRRAPLCAGT